MLAFALDAHGSLARPRYPRLTPVSDIIDDPKLQLDPKVSAAGQDLFDAACSGCHGLAAASLGAAPDLAASRIAANRNTFDGAVKSGKLVARGMPRFDDLSEPEIDGLFQFIRSSARHARHGATSTHPAGD